MVELIPTLEVGWNALWPIYLSIAAFVGTGMYIELMFFRRPRIEGPI